MKEIKMQATGDGAAEIYIYDFIGDDGMGGGVSAKGFADKLDAMGAVNQITVRINSPGGSAWDGTAIYNALVRHPSKVVCEVDGIAASAASFIMMAGDEIRVAENSTIMIHCASGLVIGPAEEMEKTAVMLRKMDNQIAGVYAKRTNRRMDTWLKMMADETWFNAQEAVDNRLADSITPNKKAVASFSVDVWNRVSKRPDKIAALLGSPEIIQAAAPELSEEISVEMIEQESAAAIAERLAAYKTRAAEVQA